MALRSIPPSESPAPRVTETVFQDTLNDWYIKDGTRHLLVTDDNRLIGPLATISPADCLRFHVVDSTRETAGDVLKIFNHSTNQNIAYKVKSTSPDSYLVRPNIGFIKPEETAEVELLLRPNFGGIIQPNVCNDKFLVQIVKIDKKVTPPLDIQDMWRTMDVHSTTYMEHRIWCTLEHRTEEDATWSNIESHLCELNKKIDENESHEESDEQLMKKIKRKIDVKNRNIRNKLEVATGELENMDRRNKKLATEKTFILRFIQFKIFMMVLLVVIVFVLSYMSINKGYVYDMASCPDNLATGCIFPTLPFW